MPLKASATLMEIKHCGETFVYSDLNVRRFERNSPMRRHLIAFVAALVLPAAALADGVKTYGFDGGFSDAAFGVENAIVNQGLVVDNISHVGEMLNRTGADVGSEVDIFTAADVYQFCSAALSRKVMEADFLNIAHCPYSIFVAQVGDKVMVGYREMPEGVMKEVEALLDAIARDAVGG
jgi:uncharacterized protein (DUF302 family)